MREIVGVDGGRKLFNEDWEDLEEHLAALESQFEGEEPFVLSGITFDTQVGNTWVMRKGIVWLGGKLRSVPEKSVDFTSALYINATISDETRQYIDGVSKVAIKDYGTDVNGTDTGGNNSIRIDDHINFPIRRYKADVLNYLHKTDTANQSVKSKVTIENELVTTQKATLNSLEVGGDAIIGDDLTVTDNLSVGDNIDADQITLRSSGAINLSSSSARISDTRSFGGTTDIVKTNGKIRNERIETDSDATFVSASENDNWNGKAEKHSSTKVKWSNYPIGSQMNYRVMWQNISVGFESSKNLITISVEYKSSDTRPNGSYGFLGSIDLSTTSKVNPPTGTIYLSDDVKLVPTGSDSIDIYGYMAPGGNKSILTFQYISSYLQ